MKSKIFKLLIWVTLLIGGQKLYAQDIIILLDGNEIQSIVKEIGTDIIKYNKFDNQTGPLYSIEKAKVFMIKYQNGTKDIINQINNPSNNNQNQPIKDSVKTPTLKKIPIPSMLIYQRGIKYVNTGSELNDATIVKLYTPYPMALAAYQKGLSKKSWGEVMSYVSIGSMLYGLYRSTKVDPIYQKSVMLRWIGIGAFFWGFEIGLKVSGRKKMELSVNLYNAEIQRLIDNNK